MRLKLFTTLALAVFTINAKAEMPVKAHPNQKVLLESEDQELKKNKKLVYDFFRIVLKGYQLNKAKDYLSEDYIQHNPNVKTGLKGFVEFFSKYVKKDQKVPDTLKGLVSIQAENDFVTLSFVRNLKSKGGKSYSTTWFDMFRVKNGKIVEHWDSAELWE